MPAVRGSTANRGGNALREMIRRASDSDIVMTPDGPRGPRREMSRGAVFLASRSGRAIVPTAFSCENSWSIQEIVQTVGHNDENVQAAVNHQWFCIADGMVTIAYNVGNQRSNSSLA